MKDNIKVSIIIPVYNDEKGLVKCLGALTKQEYSKDSFEIIVVDNGSTDKSIEKAKKFSNVTLLTENNPGSYAARNKGINEAQYSILAFLDADCIAHKDWLVEGVKALSDIDYDGLVAGKIEFTFNTPENPSLIELFDSITYLDNKKNAEKFGFSVTANMFTTKKMFDEVGLFDAAMKSGGDREWGMRIQKRDKDTSFANRAIIYHHARDSYAELITKTRRVIPSVIKIEKKSSNKMLTILLEFIPPIKRTFNILTNQKIARIDKRLALIAIAYFFKLVGAIELLRLSIGFSAQR